MRRQIRSALKSLTSAAFLHLSPAYLAASAALACSMVANVSFGWSFGTTLVDHAVGATASAASDIFKAAGFLFFAVAIRNRDLLRCLAALFIVSVTVLYSLTAAVGYTTSARGDAITSRTVSNDRFQRARQTVKAATELQARAKLAIDEDPLARPISEHRAEIASIKRHKRWVSSNECKNATATKSIKLCNRYDKILAGAAKYKKFEDGSKQLAQASRLLDQLPPPKRPDAQSDAIALALTKITGDTWSAADIASLLPLLLVALIEGLSSFGFLLASSKDRRAVNDPVTHRPAFDTEQVHAHGRADNYPARPSTSTQSQLCSNDLLPVLQSLASHSAPGVSVINGAIHATQNTIAAHAGSSASTVNKKLRQLQAQGAIALRTTPQGSEIRLAG